MSKPYLKLRKSTLLLGSTLTVMAGAIVAASLPLVSREFQHIAHAEILSKLILTLPALFMALLAPIAGYFTDSLGRKKVLIISLLLYAVAGTSGLYLNNIYGILVGRAILGIATGGLITAIITLIGDYFEGEERNRFMGLQSAFAGLGGLVFISTGGILADIHWRLPFSLYFASLILAVMAIISIRETVGCKKTVQPLKNLETTKKSIFDIIPQKVYLIYAIALLSMIVFYMIPVQMPFMLSKIDGITNSHIGFAIAFMNLASVSMAFNYAKIKKRLSFKNIMGIAYFLIFVGYMVISQSSSYFPTITGILICGLGFGLIMPTMNLWLVTEAPVLMRGRLVGYLNSALFFGMFLSPIVLQPLIKITSIETTFFWVGIALLLGSLVFLSFTSKQNKP